MNAALKYFQDEKNVIAGLNHPDAGIDYIFMLNPSDFEVLLSEWSKHSDQWKEGILYFSGFLYMNESGNILLKGLLENKDELAVQALLSIHQSLSTEKEENKMIDYTLSPENQQLILKALEKYKSEIEIYISPQDLKKWVVGLYIESGQ